MKTLHDSGSKATSSIADCLKLCKRERNADGQVYNSKHRDGNPSTSCEEKPATMQPCLVSLWLLKCYDRWSRCKWMVHARAPFYAPACLPLTVACSTSFCHRLTLL